MRVIGFDTETHKITPGNLTPRPVVATFAEPGQPAVLLTPDEGVVRLRQELEAGTIIATANGSYDAGVLCNYDPSLYPLVFAAFADGRLRDIQDHEKLKDISRGALSFKGYSLAELEQKYLGRDRSAEKKTTDGSVPWRLRYAELDGVPLDQWPEDAARYAREDAEGTLEVFLKQGTDPLPGEILITRSNWALHLMSARGMITDPEAVARLKAELQTLKAQSSARLANSGFYKLSGSKKAIAEGRGTITKDMAAIRARVEQAYKGRTLPRTDSGKVGTDRDALEHSGDADLEALADVGFVDKLLSTYVPVLERGTTAPLMPRYGIAESCRTTCSGGRDGDDGMPLGFNCQQLPRKGNVRETFLPRPGYYFVSVDYDTLELRALAQVCLNLFGTSKMAEAIRSGKDLHLEFGAQLLGIPYEDAVRRKKEPEVKEARQFAKVANFGLPGGLGARTFVEYARTGYGVEMTESRAKGLKAQWLRAWPEMQRYFGYISDLTDRSDRIKSFGEGMVRGGVSYTAACNHLFQNLAAQGARAATFDVSRECYVDVGSSLFGSRPVAMVHDELLVEVPVEKAHEASMRIAELMCAAMSKYIPDVPITASPALMTRWLKGAEPLFDASGRLVPWEPLTSS